MVRELQAAGLAVARSPKQGVVRQRMHLAQDGCEKPEILKGLYFLSFRPEFHGLETFDILA